MLCTAGTEYAIVIEQRTFCGFRITDTHTITFNVRVRYDLVAVSGFADWNNPAAVSLMAWLNDGHQGFTPVPLASDPIKLMTAAVGDLDGDGIPEIVTGALHAFPPYEKLSNITLWRRQ